MRTWRRCGRAPRDGPRRSGLPELSLQRNPDPSGFIAGFAGDDRAVSDYLISEVLSGHDEETLGFLLRTSIVERVNGELAEALTGVADGRHALHELSRAEGFVDALDSTGAWFRYHPLFAEVLRAELKHRFPDELPEPALQPRAAGTRPTATRSRGPATRSPPRDWQLAAELIGEHWLACVVGGSGAALRELAEQIPGEVIDRRRRAGARDGRPSARVRRDRSRPTSCS